MSFPELVNCTQWLSWVLLTGVTLTCSGVLPALVQAQTPSGSAPGRDAGAPPAQSAAPPLPGTAHLTVDFGVGAQRVDGFGFSEAFGQAATLERLPEAERREVLDLLFGRERGAAFTILRLGLGAGTTLEPEDPGGSEAKPKYVWDGSDGGQVWLAREAMRAGVTQFTADAWTAPPFMKSSRAKIGGILCGVEDATPDAASTRPNGTPGAKPNAAITKAAPTDGAAGSQQPCTADWRKAFAALLLASVRRYRDAGVPVASLSFLNEPEIHVSYESMLWTPDQAAAFLGVLGPMARKQMPGLKLACCDASTWRSAGAFTEAVMASPARQFVDLVTAHEYGVHAEKPLVTDRPVWMTEWSSGNPRFEARWDCSGCFGGPDGMYLARDVLRAFRDGGVSAYLYWWGAGDEPAVLIHTEDQTGRAAAAPVEPGTSSGLVVGKRFYALAMVSRFVQPGAAVVPVSLGEGESGVEAAAFRNPDGGGLVSLVNLTRIPKRVELHVSGFPAGLAAGTNGAAVFITDEARSIRESGVARMQPDGRVVIEVSPRSMMSLVFAGDGKQGKARPVR